MGPLDISNFNMDDFKEIEEFTFCINIKILNEIDMKGMLIYKNPLESKWNEYIETQNKERQRTKLQLPSNKTSNWSAQSIKGKRNEVEAWLKSNNLSHYYGMLVLNGFTDMDKFRNAMDFEKNEVVKIIGCHKEQDAVRLIKAVQRLKIEDKTQDTVRTSKMIQNSHDKNVEIGTAGFVFEPYHETKNCEDLYFHHISVETKFKRISPEELRLVDVHGQLNQEKSTSNDMYAIKDSERRSWLYLIYQFVWEVLNDSN